MKNFVKSLKCLFFRCALFLFSCSFAQQIWGDCLLTVTLSEPTLNIIVADDDNTATLAITASPVLTRDEGELKELEDGKCGESSFTFTWYPQPTMVSNSGRGAGFILEPGVHTISCNVVYLDECCTSTACGFCTVEVVQSCKNRKSNNTHTVATELPDIKQVTGKLSETLKKLPLCSDADLTIGGGAQAKIGEMCCSGTEDTGASPVEYKELSGNLEIDASVQFSIPGWNGIFNFGAETPIHWKAEFKYVIGPTATVSINGSGNVSGQISPCGKCVNVTLGVDGTLQIAFGGTFNAALEVFEQGNWYSVNTGVDFVADVFGETGFGGNTSYQNGEACEDQGLTASAYFGSLDVGVNFIATYKGMGLSYTLKKHLSDGFTTN